MWRIIARITTLFAVVIGVSQAAQAATLDVCLDGSCTYSDIKSAVVAASPGDTITVGPGVYALSSQILINKPLSIVGAGAGQTIIDGGLANINGTSTDGMIRVHTSRDGPINLSGFTVKNFSRKNASAIRVGIMVRSNATNVFPNTYPVNLSHIETVGSALVDTAPDYGIYVAGIATHPEPPITLDHIKTSGHRSNSILIEDWRSDITLTDSELNEGPTGSTSLFIGHGVPLDGPNLGKITIDNNKFIGRGIAVSQTAPGRVNGGWNDIEITNNQITGLDNTDTGIAIQAPAAAGTGQSIESLVVEGNFIQGAGYSLSDPSHHTYGIRLTGAMDTASVRSNEIIGTNLAVRSSSNASGSPALTVAQNRLASNEIGVENTSNIPVLAPANWWGCSDNPHNNPICANTSENPGDVVIDTWVVRTNDAPSTLESGQTITINFMFNTLDTGDSVTLPTSTHEISSVTFTAPDVDSPQDITTGADGINTNDWSWLGEAINITVTPPAPPVNPPAPPPVEPYSPKTENIAIPGVPNTGIGQFMSIDKPNTLSILIAIFTFSTVGAILSYTGHLLSRATPKNTRS